MNYIKTEKTVRERFRLIVKDVFKNSCNYVDHS